VRRGELTLPDPDDLAAKYEAADAALTAAGMSWYEVSNWASRPEARCRHNVSYWRGDDWWGVGPGAHSHVGGVRWWNVKHPGAYSARLLAGRSPAHAREVLDDDAREVERVLLGVRLADGLDVAALPPDGLPRLPEVVAEGLVEPGPEGVEGAPPSRVVLTDRGRLLADGVVRRLLGW
jgi:coproporphyrinogen III oxidase-like Fe-S oxidoreductase